MKVICSLCEREGKPGYLGEREPLDNPAVTHGLCSPHTEQLLESIPSRSFPDADLLIVVRPNDTELSEYLQRSFAGVHHAQAIVERRGPDRRREPRVATPALRQHPRRIQRRTVPPLGYSAERSNRKWSPPLPR